MSALRLALLALGISLIAIAILSIVSCNGQSRVLTPDKNDPAYHCHDKDTGEVIADAVWCYPVDGTHECCPVYSECSTLNGVPNCPYVGSAAVVSNSHGQYWKRAPAKRMPE
jgi:hypothetical protein